MANLHSRKKAGKWLKELQESEARHPLPKVEQITAPPPDRLIAICTNLFRGKDWLLLTHGTCLSTNGTRADQPERSLDGLLEDWKKYGGGMEGGAALLLNNGLGWMVSCEGLPEAISIILTEELEPNPHPAKITLFGFTKRAADFRNPRVIHREM